MCIAKSIIIDIEDSKTNIFVAHMENFSEFIDFDNSVLHCNSLPKNYT